MSTIFLLNGVSSTGKTSIGKALQAMLPTPFLQVQIDQFEEMMPNRGGEGEAFGWESLFPRVLRGFHASLAALAGAGNDLIADHVMVHREGWASTLSDCLQQLQPHTVYFVGVYCEPEELRRREAARKDRVVGTVDRQLPRVHGHRLYDVAVDTTHRSSEACAADILAWSREHRPTAFPALRERVRDTGRETP